MEEFSYFYDGGVTRPGEGAPAEDWVAYVYLRENKAGAHSELWYHDAACRQFLHVERDTRTHEILSVRLA